MGVTQLETSHLRFRNRRHAGRALATQLSRYRCTAERPSVVLALPRGGVPVGFEVARALAAPLDILLVRKLGLPGHTELAMGAIASGGIRVLNDEIVESLGIPESMIEKVARWEQHELERREHVYRGDRPAIPIEGRAAILVDDGLATGATMRAAARSARGRSPARVIVAVPVGSRDTVDALRREADEVVCIDSPEPFYAVGLWYDDFTPTTDDDVIALLARAHGEPTCH
jgi:putative phosphoribosyl transferase